MGTIPFNADATLNEGTQDKKKFEINDKAKAAMAAGGVGVAAGAGVKAAVDALNNETDEDSYSEPEKQDIHADSTAQTVTLTESTESTESISTAEVNPDKVMLEEPVLETTVVEQVADNSVSNAEDSVYHPFANNDVLEDVVYDGVMSVDDLYAQGDESDIELDVNPIDLICGEPDYVIDETIETIEDINYHPDDNYAWESEANYDTDIQTDLMA